MFFGSDGKGGDSLVESCKTSAEMQSQRKKIGVGDLAVAFEAMDKRGGMWEGNVILPKDVVGFFN